jgi:hypothetical protein
MLAQRADLKRVPGVPQEAKTSHSSQARDESAFSATTGNHQSTAVAKFDILS